MGYAAVAKRPTLLFVEDVTNLAVKIFSLYTNFRYEKGALWGTHGIHKYNKLSSTDRVHFRDTAKLLTRLKAKPRDWIAAQFENFGKRLWVPRPHHLHTDQALTRYVEFMGIRADDLARVPKLSDRVGGEHDREERMLAGLVKFLDRAEEAVLIDHCDDFTQSFLEYKGVWDRVEDDHGLD